MTTWTTACSFSPHSQAAEDPGHTPFPFIYARAETSDTGAEGAKPNPRCSLQGHISRVGSDAEEESTERRSALHNSALRRWFILWASLLLSSNELMSCCAADTNGCLDLRCRAFPPGGHVSAEWSRCPQIAWHGMLDANDSVATLQRSSASWLDALEQGVPTWGTFAYPRGTCKVSNRRKINIYIALSMERDPFSAKKQTL